MCVKQNTCVCDLNFLAKCLGNVCAITSILVGISSLATIQPWYLALESALYIIVVIFFICRNGTASDIFAGNKSSQWIRRLNIIFAKRIEISFYTITNY